MKITGVGSSSASSAGKRTDKARRSGGAGFAQQLQAAESHGDDDLSGLDGPKALSSLESLLVVQAVDEVDPEQQGRARKRLMHRGDELLDRLEDIRRGLLLGTIPVERLEQLSNLVRSQREQGADPYLSAILDEIELRAQVELAKLERL